MPARFRVVPAAYVFLRRSPPAGDPEGAGDAVLLMLRRGTGYMDGHWAAVAGHVEAEESCVDAAVREVREEVGVQVRAGDLQPLCTLHRTHADHRWIDERADFFFQTWTWTGEPTLREPARSAALRWWPLGRLPDPTVPHEALVLSHLRAGAMPAILTFGFDAT